MKVAKGSLTVDSTMFYSSPVHIYRWAYVSNYLDANQVKIKFNFPLVPGILRDHLYLLAKEQHWNEILKNPVVRGNLSEYEFFNANGPIVLSVKLCNGINHTLVFSDYDVQRADAVLTRMKLNTLYRLRYGHSVIDGIGLLSTGIAGEEWLVFVQVSIQAYSEHSSKLTQLFTNYVDCKGHKELSTKNLTSVFATNKFGVNTSSSSIESLSISLPSSSDNSPVSTVAGKKDFATGVDPSAHNKKQTTIAPLVLSSCDLPVSYFDYYKRLAMDAGVQVDSNHVLYLYVSTKSNETTFDLMKEHSQGLCSIALLSSNSSCYQLLEKFCVFK